MSLIMSRWPDGTLFSLSLERQSIPREQVHEQNPQYKRFLPLLGSEQVPAAGFVQVIS